MKKRAAMGMMVLVLVSSTAALAQTSLPQPPTPPPGYTAGPVVNGGFEYGGYGWNYSGGRSSQFSVAMLQASPQEWAGKLTVRGEWQPPAGPWPGMGMGWRYQAGYATVTQTVYVPLDATVLTFAFAADSQSYPTYSDPNYFSEPPVAPSPYVEARLGQSGRGFSAGTNWTTAVIPIGDADKGKRLTLSLGGSDGGYGSTGGYSWPAPTSYASADIYLDYVGINGTVPSAFVTSTWSGAVGGAWEDSAPWSSPQSPNNTMATIYDVRLNASGGSDGDVTLSSSRTIQSLQHSRAAALTILAGGSLTVYEDTSISGGGLTIQDGGQFVGKSNLTVSNGSLAVHPSGGSGRPAALAVQGSLSLTGNSMMTARDASLVSGLSIGSSSQVTFNNVALSGGMSVAGGGTANLENVSLGSISNQGNVTLRGQNSIGSCYSGSSYPSASGVLTIDGGTTSATDVAVDSGQIILNNATLNVAGTLRRNGYYSYSSSGGSIRADATSTLAVGQVDLSGPRSVADWDLSKAHVTFNSPYSTAVLPTKDRGARDFGGYGNLGMGTLEVAEGKTLNVNAPAIYVTDVVLGQGTTLNLNGARLYYTGSITNDGGTITGGTVEKATVRPTDVARISTAGFTAVANGVSQQDGPAESYSEQTCPGGDPYLPPTIQRMYARADLRTYEDAAIVSLAAGSQTDGPGSYYPYPPSGGGADVFGTLTVLPDTEGSHQDGDLVHILIQAFPTGDFYDPSSASWHATVSLEGQTLADLGSYPIDPSFPNTDPLVVEVPVGATLDISATIWRSGSSGSSVLPNWDYGLDVVIASVPEPATLLFLVLGGLGLVRRRLRYIFRCAPIRVTGRGLYPVKL